MSIEAVLDQTCTVYRTAASSRDRLGQIQAVHEVHDTDVPCREVMESAAHRGFENAEGNVAKSAILFSPDTDILEADEIELNSRRYKIGAIDSDPGSAGFLQIAQVSEVRT